jgi:tetratricopeptide (TPR) repeat protein
MGNYKKSVSDIEKVLELEPRHFGAIAGLAGILTERGSKDAALKAWERYLEVFPADREAQEIVAKLSEELAGQRT